MNTINFGWTEQKSLINGKYETPDKESYYDIIFCKDTKSIVTHGIDFLDGIIRRDSSGNIRINDPNNIGILLDSSQQSAIFLYSEYPEITLTNYHQPNAYLSIHLHELLIQLPDAFYQVNLDTSYVDTYIDGYEATVNIHGEKTTLNIEGNETLDIILKHKTGVPTNLVITDTSRGVGDLAITANNVTINDKKILTEENICIIDATYTELVVTNICHIDTYLPEGSYEKIYDILYKHPIVYIQFKNATLICTYINGDNDVFAINGLLTMQHNNFTQFISLFLYDNDHLETIIDNLNTNCFFNSMFAEYLYELKDNNEIVPYNVNDLKLKWEVYS